MWHRVCLLGVVVAHHCFVCVLYCAVLCIASECADVCGAIEGAVQMVCLSCVALARTLTSALHAVACRAMVSLKSMKAFRVFLSWRVDMFIHLLELAMH